MAATEAKKRKRKFNYTLMLFADSKEGRIRQMGIGSTLVEVVAVTVVCVIAILALICHRQAGTIVTLTTGNEEMSARIVELEQENTDLASLREELTEKVTILSDTINQKVEEEEAQAEIKAQAHMPIGFPMSSSASIREADTENPMVQLTGSAGASIVASGDGVVSITTDSTYSHCIKVDHGNGYVSIYRNDGDVMVREGDEVVRGAILYVIGEDNTELGYQITYDENYVNPMELLSIDG